MSGLMFFNVVYGRVPEGNKLGACLYVCPICFGNLMGICMYVHVNGV